MRALSKDHRAALIDALRAERPSGLFETQADTVILSCWKLMVFRMADTFTRQYSADYDQFLLEAGLTDAVRRLGGSTQTPFSINTDGTVSYGRRLPLARWP